MEYALTAHGLVKDYRRFRALDGLELAVPKGAIYGLVGQNGAGKTTLIRIITGLQRPTAGEYTLLGVDSRERGAAEVRKRVGAVVETPSICLDLTARENLIQQFRVLGLREEDRARELLELVGLADTGRKKARQFSLGMKQRLGIAVALCGRPEFLVLDEPINGLDPKGILEIRRLLLELNQEQGVTILISSHILSELAKLATHYGFMDRGRMLRQVRAQELEEELAAREGEDLEDYYMELLGGKEDA